MFKVILGCLGVQGQAGLPETHSQQQNPAQVGPERQRPQTTFTLAEGP